MYLIEINKNEQINRMSGYFHVWDFLAFTNKTCYFFTKSVFTICKVLNGDLSLHIFLAKSNFEEVEN